MLKSLLLSAAMLLPTVSLAAPAGISLSPDKSVTMFHGAPMKRVMPAWSAPKGKKAIIDTLGKPVSYDTGFGWTVTNGGGAAGPQQWIAYPITPTTDTTVTEIAEAVGNIGGEDSVTVALLADAGGLPGAVLSEKTVKNLEAFGDCCSVAAYKLKKGIPVKAGTQYWVGAILKKKSTAWNAFNLSTVNTATVPFASYNDGWSIKAGTYTAFAVYGS